MRLIIEFWDQKLQVTDADIYKYERIGLHEYGYRSLSSCQCKHIYGLLLQVE